MAKNQPEHDLKVAIGLRLRAARKALNLRQKDLAGPIHVEQNTWSQWEKGVNMPDAPAMIRFCNRYGITMDWIYRDVSAGLPHEIHALVLGEHAALTGASPTTHDRLRA